MSDNDNVKYSEFLTTKEAAKYLNMSPTTLRNWDKTGKLKAVRNPYNNYRRYKVEDLNNVLLELNEPRAEYKARNLFTRDISELKDKVLQGDCLDLMRYIPDKSIDMILCDLPYGTTQNKWDSLIDLSELWKEYSRVVKPNGAIVLTSQGIFTAKLILSNEKDFKYKIIWEKSKPTNFLNAKKQPLRKYEDVCVFYKKQPTYNPQMKKGEPYNKGVRKNQLTGSYGDFESQLVKSDGDRYPTDVVYFKTAESEGEVLHPTQKPVELGRYLVRTYTNEGDLILDNTFGSGSFLVSAALENRNFCGIEKNQDVSLFKKESISYIDVAKQRLEKAGYTARIVR